MVSRAAVEIALGLTTIDKTTWGQGCDRAALLALGTLLGSRVKGVKGIL